MVYSTGVPMYWHSGNLYLHVRRLKHLRRTAPKFEALLKKKGFVGSHPAAAPVLPNKRCSQTATVQTAVTNKFKMT